MKRCHHVIVKNIGRVLIPGCESTAWRYDISYCTCASPEYSMAKLQTTIAKLRKRIEAVESELRKPDL